MKKILLRLLAIIVLAVLAFLARNYTTQQTELPPSEVVIPVDTVKLGIIPVYFDESSLTPLVGVNEAGEEVAPALPTTSEMMTEVKLAGDKVGTLLDYYTETVNLWRIIQSSYFLPEVELVFAKQGCVSSTTSFDGPSAALLQAEKEINAEGVQSIVYVPCPTDETRLAKGREQLRTALTTLRNPQPEELFTGEETTLDNPMQQNVEPDIIEHGDTGNAIRNMEFVGIGFETGEPIDETTYVFRTTNGFPTINLFVSYEVWIKYGATFEGVVFDTGALYIFSGEVTYLDAAMGNRYYEATRIDELTRVRSMPAPFNKGGSSEGAGDLETQETSPIPSHEGGWLTQEAVNEQLDRRNYCEVDEDCEVFYGECPFGCRQVLNKQFVEPAKQLIQDYRKASEAKGEPQCIYGCMALDDAVIQCGPAGTPKAGKCQIIRE